MLFAGKTKEFHENKDWSLIPIDIIFNDLKSSRLGIGEEDAKNRLKKYGNNTIKNKDHWRTLRRIWVVARDPIVLILYISGTVVYLIGQHFDAYVIFSTLVLNIIITFIQDKRVSNAFSLLQNTDKFHAHVRRGGVDLHIPSEDLVVGDIVILRAGNKILADIRITKELDLQVNESVLTGEWTPVNKQSLALINPHSILEQLNMGWKGTTIVSGEGEGIVIATGERTEIGKISYDLYETKTETPLQKQVGATARLILSLITIGVLAIVLISILQDIPLYETLFIAIAISVAGVPSGLPAAITVVLVYGMQQILKKKGLVRNLLAAETLGSTTWILTDKTGTLTKGVMALVDIINIGKTEILSKFISKESSQLIYSAYMATDGKHLSYSDNGEDVYVGTSIEKALVHAYEDNVDNSTERVSRMAYLPFTSNRRYSAAITKKNTGLYQYSALGAPEVILKNAKFYYKDGKAVNMTEKERSKFKKLISDEGEKGRRVIAVGIVPSLEISDEELLKLKQTSEDSLELTIEEQEYVFGGILSLSDTVREDVPDAINFIYNAHIDITVVTGDNRHTALQIAKEAGIIREGDSTDVVEGKDIINLSDDELFATAQYVKVFARMLPDQKSRLLRVLLSRGEVVAMTGDGVNDASSLHRASIGIAVASGTDVAKESSDLILLDNSFLTITNTILIGRNIISNLKKILIYLLSTSFSEAILVGGAILFSGVLPITPVQILWANIVEEAFISFAFAFEKGDPSDSKINPKQKKKNNILSSSVRGIIISLSVTTGLFLIGLFIILHSYTDLTELQVQTIMFLTVSLDSIFLALSLKQLRKSILHINIFDNLWLVGAIIISIILLVIVFFVPSLSEILSIVPVPIYTLSLIAFVTAVYHIIVIEVLKNIFFKRIK